MKNLSVIQLDSMKFEFRVTDDDGAVISGNDNAGHEYNLNKLDEAAKDALLEYLKTL